MEIDKKMSLFNVVDAHDNWRFSDFTETKTKMRDKAISASLLERNRDRLRQPATDTIDLDTNLNTKCTILASAGKTGSYFDNSPISYHTVLV